MYSMNKNILNALEHPQNALILFDYFHYSDWTFRVSDLAVDYDVLGTFVDSSTPFIVEYALVKVKSKDDLRGLLKTMVNHKNVLGIDEVKPLNSTYPRLISMVVRGDYADSTRYRAHILGGFEVSYSTSGGVEHWGFLFPSDSLVETFIGIISGNGEVRNVKRMSINTEELVAGMVRNRARLLLTSEEAALLRIAHRRGLFSNPKRVTITELARELGVSESTLSRRLNRAIRKLISIALDDDSPHVMPNMQ